jgi:topoisomerase-4 subunit B
MSAVYDAAAIEILSGLEPVRKRPGMYTDTSRPNHLAQEVIDNSVDEAMAGHASRIDVTLYKDGSLEVRDDGRGMPTDIHPKEKIPGVEVILTRLHAGGKFSSKNYNFSGGLHGVGVSVVNALSKHLEVWVRRGGKEYNMAFADGAAVSGLEEVGKVGKQNTGTTLRFWPDPKYFDSAKFSLPRLQHVLRAKAVLCPGLRVRFHDEASGGKFEWYYEDGLKDYLVGALGDAATLPADPFIGNLEGNAEAASWALVWLPEGGEPVAESYVNLIPTAQGGTHVNGLRMGLTEAVREFCELRATCCREASSSPPRMSGTSAATFCPSSCRTPSSAARPRNACPRASVPPLSPAWSRMHRERAATPARGEEGGAQEGDQRAGAARQAGRLQLQRSRAHRAVSGRG